jgi:penicillin-binding protein 1A
MLGEFYVERRYLVPLDQVPNHVRLAFLAAEDADFYRHPGIDPFGIARALFANLANKRVVQGGSTITQQVVKTLLLTPDRNLERKVKEVILSLRLENKLSKDDILYLYLNQIYFGAGAYGVQAAARTFFDVDVGDLTIAQAAMLAGMPQRPTENDPQKHPHAARARQHYVLDRMLHEKFITDEEYQEALAEDIDVQPPHRSTCAGCSRSATAARPPRSSAFACTPPSTSSSRAWPRSRSSAGCACSIGARASAERCAACRRTRSTRS